MTDIFLYPGEPTPYDIKLSDPTTLRSGGTPQSLSAGTPSLIGSAITATLLLGALSLPATTPTVRVTANAASVQLGAVALSGGTPIVRVTPAAAAVAPGAVSASAGSPLVQLQAPAAAVSGALSFSAGTPLLQLTASSAVLSTPQALPATTPTIVLSAIAATLDGGEQTAAAPLRLSLHDYTIDVPRPKIRRAPEKPRLPTAKREETVSREPIVAERPAPAEPEIVVRTHEMYARTPTLTLSAPTARLELGDQVLGATSPVTILCAPAAQLTAARTFTAGVAQVQLHAVQATLVVGWDEADDEDVILLLEEAFA